MEIYKLRSQRTTNTLPITSVGIPCSGLLFSGHWDLAQFRGRERWGRTARVSRLR